MKNQSTIDSDSIPPQVPKDIQVRTFQPPEDLRLIPGEVMYTIITRVEDCKAHPGQFGQIQITNIRIIWFIPKAVNLNVSIGYKSLINYTISETVQPGVGPCEILFIKCKEMNRTFEFIFSVARSKQSMFRFFEVALKNYDSSPLLREQKLRSSLIKDNNLILLSGEQVMKKVDGVANFSGDVAKVGTAIVTNYRFVWYSEIVSNFNVSIPLILLPELRASRSRRYGRCLYLKINSGGVNYMYGFTLQPEDALIEFSNELETIRSAAARMPLLTPPLTITKVEQAVPPALVEEDLELQDADPSLLYLPCDVIEEGKSSNIVFDKTLGLAIEALPSGDTLAERWNEASNTPLVDVDEL
ncbi:Bardet-Biedl syndrome 5 protein like protein [Tritrichomonas foetus]|uniref:Bardet-Biedl syndrome 5 protein like protein n=1 Tax=Tritrichomonas foetus TaxID=1144522 RepID=A0A1J4JWI6_9EUKA|nr:Bardet-Biedl syndrome 5 protein like protein [Tritrichomonas foetus]|eukprot:OHT03363.1 Bardet-Biedl syndrome 5 protein like protein [Tritrichomonas foetus]